MTYSTGATKFRIAHFEDFPLLTLAVAANIQILTFDVL